MTDIARLRAENERLARELADTQAHLRMDREAVAALRDREQRARQQVAEIRAAIVRELAETHGNAAYLADNLAAVRGERDEYASDAERHRTEARQASEDAGRRMRLIVQLQAALCGAPRTAEVRAALDAVDVEARRSPWLAERITSEEADRG